MNRVLIADALDDARDALVAQIRKTCQVATCSDGATALKLLRTLRPDVMILDLMLPELDGLSVLQAASEEGLRPITVVTSRFYSDYIIHVLERHAVDYVVLKPCSVDVMVTRVEELLARRRQSDPAYPSVASVVTARMYDLGIPTNLAGFEQARIGIMLLAESPGQMVTKELYPAIAARCPQKTSPSSVERNIRTAIQIAWRSRDNAVWQRYFRPSVTGEVPRPTNTQFLTRLADSIAQNLQIRA